MRLISSDIAATRRPPVHRASAPGGAGGIIAVIERRGLIRDCLARALRAAGYETAAFPAIEDWLPVADRTPVSAIVLSCPESLGAAEPVRHAMRRLSAVRKPVPVIVLADGDAPGQIAHALNCGARGYIPTNLPLDVAAEAIRLVNAGGVFVPVSCLSGLHAGSRAAAPGAAGPDRLFTARQAAVIEGIRRGKANKTIAYELNLRESTVKVHIRNIMKKLKARNRTEVAYIAGNLVDTCNL
jgi:DNA-binding NarL/FixJ family response regulator